MTRTNALVLSLGFLAMGGSALLVAAGQSADPPWVSRAYAEWTKYAAFLFGLFVGFMALAHSLPRKPAAPPAAAPAPDPAPYAAPVAGPVKAQWRNGQVGALVHNPTVYRRARGGLGLRLEKFIAPRGIVGAFMAQYGGPGRHELVLEYDGLVHTFGGVRLEGQSVQSYAADMAVVDSFHLVADSVHITPDSRTPA